MTRREFAKGLTRVCVACNRALDDLVVEVYAEALGHQATAEEWDSFTREAVASGRFRFFPTVAELVDALHEHQGARPLEVEAGEAYERVLAAGCYTPNGGTTWTYRGVLASCGRAAAEGFLAAGGNSAFVTAWDEPKRRAAFGRAYVATVRAEPAARLLPAGTGPKALPSAEREPTREEARDILRRLSGMAREGAA
jgi:hypothetical protein